MNNDEYLTYLSKSKTNRVIAWILIIMIIGIIIATLVTGIMGSPYFMGCLVLCIMFPILVYVALWIGRVLRNIGLRKLNNTENDKVK